MDISSLSIPDYASLSISASWAIKNGDVKKAGADPREEAIYYAWLVDGKPLAITNVYIYPEEIWIGDFEVSKYHKGEGLGKLLFNALKDEFPGIGFGLTYRDENAKKFWLKMGFKPTGNGHVMVYEY